MIEQHRPIRSFVRRSGRITKAQSEAIKTLWPKYGLELNGEVDFVKTFGRSAPCILEIGFGMGEILIELAQKNLHQDYIGVDVYEPGVGKVLQKIKELDLTNVRLFCTDAIEVLHKGIPNESLEAVHLFFPDPWPKTRHHKRRIVQPSFAELIRSKLKIDGYIHIATDWENYAEHIMHVMTNCYGFLNPAGISHYIERQNLRPESKFERRGKKLGLKVWDLMFIREI